MSKHFSGTLLMSKHTVSDTHEQGTVSDTLILQAGPL